MNSTNITSMKDMNYQLYDHYYDKPSLWFKIRYRTRIKDLYCKYLLMKTGSLFKNKTILELGFGHGNVLLSFPTENRIIGSELSNSAIRKMVRKAVKKGFYNYQFYSVLEHPVIKDKVKEADIVIASHIIEHVENDEKLICDIYDIMNKGGYFIVLIPLNELKEDPMHVRKYSVDSFLKINTNIGFKCEHNLEFDYAFSFFEKIYWNRDKSFNGLLNRILWKLISLLMGLWPIGFYKYLDKHLLRFDNIKPHQAGFIFRKD